MPVPSAAFQLDGQTSTDTLLGSLAALLPCRHVEGAVRRTVLYDSCDGRLRRAGHLLWTESESGRTRLCWRVAGETADGQAELQPGASLDFAWDLPEPARTELSDAAGPRRLLPVLEVERDERGLDVLDDQGKVVARVRVPQGRARAAEAPEWETLPAVLTVDAVRGYADAHRDVLLIVATRPGLLPAQGEPASLERLSASLPPPSKPAPPAVRPDMRADAGLQLILRAQLEALEANERGVRDDVDTEYLHDFRVAVRRTRTLLRQFRSVLRAPLVEHLRAEFGWLGRASNAVRDLDVFLLWLREQPPDPALAPVVEALRGRRRAAHELLVVDLDSPRYRELIEGWREVLHGPPVATTPEGEQPPQRAAQPLAQVVARRLRRTYRRLLDASDGLDARSPATELHGLRIRAKHLRYVLDATAPIHDPRAHEKLGGALRKLQTALGECNDVHVQRSMLDPIAEELGRSSDGTAALLALGRLQAHLEERERRARKGLSDHIERLSGDKARAAVRQLTRPRTEGDEP